MYPLLSTIPSGVRTLAKIAGSNPARSVDVSLMCVVCCQIEASATGRSPIQRGPINCVVSN